MHSADVLGYAASALVFLAFYMQSIFWLRVIALASNVCFLGYALSMHLVPVMVLHVALMPVNAWRLLEHLRGAYRVHGVAS